MKRKKILFQLFDFFLGGIILFQLFRFQRSVLQWDGIIPGIRSFFLVLFFLFSLFMLYVFLKQKKLVLHFLSFFFLLGIFLFTQISISYLNKTSSFLNAIAASSTFEEYRVFVLPNSSFTNIYDLEGKNIGYLKKDKQKLQQIPISYAKIEYIDIDALLFALQEEEIDALFLEKTYYDFLEEESIEMTLISIYSCSYEEPEKLEEISKEKSSYLFYISGIDQYGEIEKIKGRSDVNQCIAVNFSTHTILLLNTPRDYYIPLAGTDKKDKLTHAGIYGISKSIETLENFYEVSIDYYLRVNFNSLIEVVDSLGGIDIVSDRTFQSTTNQKVSFTTGINHVNGMEALAYARERKVYPTGDRHRGENQQQVLVAILKKIFSSKTLLKNYTSLLDALAPMIETNIPRETILSLVQKELFHTTSWQFESMHVEGTDSKNYTYSMGSQRLLYVMEPDLESVRIAKEKLKKVLG